jgi:hypothetical protein
LCLNEILKIFQNRLTKLNVLNQELDDESWELEKLSDSNKKKIDELNRAANVLKKENEYLKVKYFFQ